MRKKEFEVGEVFTAGLLKLKCVGNDSCEGCIFEIRSSCTGTNMIVGPCECTEREDNKNVIFIKAD